MVSGSKESLREVVPADVGEYSVLEVASEQSFFRQWGSVLLGIDSPSEVSSEEERSLVSNEHLLVQVELEQLLWLGRTHFIIY